MKLGLQIPSFTWDGGPERLGETLAGIARRAEQAGYDSVWVMDHFFQIPVVGVSTTRCSRPTRPWDSSPASPSGCGWARWSRALA